MVYKPLELIYLRARITMIEMLRCKVFTYSRWNTGRAKDRLIDDHIGDTED